MLNDLVNDYSHTQYGLSHNAPQVKCISDYQASFPIVNYPMLTPYFALVREGNWKQFLPEPAACWVMTRGSSGKSKVIPVTQTHLKQIYSCGARALINHAVRTRNFNLFKGGILNLNFPSSVRTFNSEGKEVSYGYSSGTYARLNPMFQSVGLLPRQEDIDALGSGISRRDWEKRFEYVYQQAKDRDVTATMGVTPVILAFARYLKSKHGKKPRDHWKLRALFCTSVPKIQFKYAPILKRYFGDAPVVEMYTATEGVFAQQLDELPYVTPNFDSYFFEVETGSGVKMLHQLKRGEWGKLIISSCILPRYSIGDYIESAGGNYFRVFGRQNFVTLLEHRLYRLFLGGLI